MNNVDSDAAARLVAQACRKKFPINKNSNSVQDLEDSLVDKIKGGANFDSKFMASLENKEWVPGDVEDLRGDIFNDNDNWYVTNLVVRIINNDTEEYRDYNVSVTTDYGGNSIPPLSKGLFRLAVYGAVKNWSWDIVKARGYEK